MPTANKISHRIANVGWLRPAVLGANDGIVSTASLVIGVAASHATHGSVLISAIAGLTAGAMSMATGEYVSVYSQADTEAASLAEERTELSADYAGETRELMAIYMRRGLDAPLAMQVAQQLMAHDAIGAHARDELGISKHSAAKPLQAAMSSACSFAAGAGIPLVAVALSTQHNVIPLVAASALLSLAILGTLAAKAGSAKVMPSVLRVTFWSALAMAVTAGIGAMFGVAG